MVNQHFLCSSLIVTDTTLKMITCWKFFQLFLVFSILLCVFGVHPTGGAPQIKCVEKERQALLKFKREITHMANLLSSWGTKEYQKDCCKWRGVYCDNRTGKIIGLNLRGSPGSERYDAPDALKGDISPSLFELKNLEYLDLSYNEFGGNIPIFFGSFTRLKYLNLSRAGFDGRIPHELRNLSSLHTLDLSFNYDLFADNLEWLLPLQSLRNLYLDDIDLSNATDWLKSVNKLPLLRELQLSSCQLPRVTPSSAHYVNSSRSLAVLDVSFNFLGSSIYTWLFNYNNSLSDINLSFNMLQGPISDNFVDMVSLMHLHLSFNELGGGIPSYFGNYTSLKSLFLSGNQLTGYMTDLIKILSGRVSSTLECLDLYSNQITGPLPDSISKFSSLKEMMLGSNKLNGSIPEVYGRLPNLTVLDLAGNEIVGCVPYFVLPSSLRELYLGENQLTGVLTETIGRLSNLENLHLASNHFEGVFSDSHLLNLSRLKMLDLSYNSHLEVRFRSNWIPPFQLDFLILRNCNIGPHFPEWLQTQESISYIDISVTGISGEIPSWFWNQFSKLYTLNLSHNFLGGTLPYLYTKVSHLLYVDLCANSFEGPVPELSHDVVIVDLSKNRFSGNLTFLCNSSYKDLQHFDLSNNQLSGQLPDCRGQLGALRNLNLANNHLSGKIPPSMSSLSIESLQLRNNSFTGELPQSWKDSKQLAFVDLGHNRLSGAIPAWVGSNLLKLVVLSLSSNNFSGNIPPNICNLLNIQILDLSGNKISGTIPKCINNLSAMTDQGGQSLGEWNTYGITTSARVPFTYNFFNSIEAILIWKRRESQYRSTLNSVKIIDLSSNNLTGVIPLEVTSLDGLIALNLSRNYLTGILTPRISKLKSLDFLDLSRNQLFGEIPSSLSELSLLGVLDLSFNNFTGRIPSGPHLQTFDASSFEGNPGLCGKPLPQACLGDELPQNPNFNGGTDVLDEEEHDENFITTGFYLSMVLGFIIGFWGVCGTLFFNRSCRHSFFRVLKEMEDWVYAITALKLARVQRRFQG